MSSTIQVRDVIQAPPQSWYDWIASPARELAMRGQLAAADAAAGDTSIVRAPDGFVRTLSIRDVGAPLAQSAADVYNHFSRLHGDCKDALESLKVEHERILGEMGDPAKKASDSSTVAVDLRSPQLRRWAADGLSDEERAAAKAVDGGAGEVLDLSHIGGPR
jgi:hypothetical protein